MGTVTLNQKQARAFATAIYADIKAYCEAHKEEFEQFLKNENDLSDNNQTYESEGQSR